MTAVKILAAVLLYLGAKIAYRSAPRTRQRIYLLPMLAVALIELAII